MNEEIVVFAAIWKLSHDVACLSTTNAPVGWSRTTRLVMLMLPRGPTDWPVTPRDVFMKSCVAYCRFGASGAVPNWVEF